MGRREFQGSVHRVERYQAGSIRQFFVDQKKCAGKVGKKVTEYLPSKSGLAVDFIQNNFF